MRSTRSRRNTRRTRCRTGTRRTPAAPTPEAYAGAVRLLLALSLMLLCSASAAQSGRARVSGWVNFEDVAYNDPQPRATVKLVHEGEIPNVYETRTDEHGHFDFDEVRALGRCRLEISADGYEPYAAGLYLPSDFIAHW